LLAIQFGWDHNVNRDVQVSASRSSTLGYTTALDAKSRTGLSAGRDVQRGIFAFESRHHDLGAEGRLWKRDRYVTVQIMFTPFKELMLLYHQHDIKITRGTALPAGIAFTGDTQFRIVVDAWRNFEFESLLSNHSAVPATNSASILDHLPRAAALAARAGDAKKSLLETYLAVAVARCTRRRPRSLLRAASTAFAAGLVTRNGDLFYRPERRFLEGQFEIVAKIGAALNSTASPRTEDVAETKNVATFGSNPPKPAPAAEPTPA
jgi:hypothetical protein